MGRVVSADGQGSSLPGRISFSRTDLPNGAIIGETYLTETRDGLDQGNPLAAPLFCMTMEKALKRLEGEFPDMKHTEYQDDVYFVVAPEKTEEVLNRITITWEEECGLQVNQSKTKIWA